MLNTLWVLLFILIIPSVSSFYKNQETCELLPVTSHAVKEDYDVTGNVLRTCEDDIEVKKCEGTCDSFLQPSVMHPNGFLKVS